MKKSYWVVVTIVVLAGSILTIWPLVPRLFRGSRLRFPYNGTPLGINAYEDLARLPGWSKSTILVDDGVNLRGLVRRPTDPIAPWILFYPGNDVTQLRTAQRFLMDLRDSQDWGLAVFAYRGFDGSDGETNYVYLARDALTILTGLCRNERLAESRVHLVGFSIGGHLATLAARDARANGKPAKSLTLFASVSDVEMLPRSRVSSLVNGENYLTLPILDEVSAPVLVLQGTADEALNGNSQGRAIAKRLGNRAQYQEFLGVGHQALLFHEAALSMTRTFVQAHLE